MRSALIWFLISYDELVHDNSIVLKLDIVIYTDLTHVRDEYCAPRIVSRDTTLEHSILAFCHHHGSPYKKATADRIITPGAVKVPSVGEDKHDAYFGGLLQVTASLVSTVSLSA